MGASAGAPGQLGMASYPAAREAEGRSPDLLSGRVTACQQPVLFGIRLSN